MTDHFTLDDILNILPHRHENILIDSLDLTSRDPVAAELKLTISEPDDLNRDLFFKKDPEKKSAFIRPFFMEFLALGSIVCLEQKENSIYIFAGISDFEVVRDFHYGDTLTGTVIKTGEKGPLVLCKGSIVNQNNEVVATGNLKASSVDVSVLSHQGSTEPVLFPDQNEAILPVWPEIYKNPSMCFVDKLIYFSQDDTGNINSTLSYTYPPTHPCIKGHFPNNPIMMGVTQMTAIEDACYVLSQKLDTLSDNQHYTIEGNATIKKETGGVVAVIKGFKVLIEGRLPNKRSSIVSTKKVAFKSMVHPDETLYIYLENTHVTS